jgi:hypothetical protein
LQVLSGNVPFYQIRQDARVAAAVATGKKPIRPSPGGNGMDEIDDGIWGPVSTCFKSKTKDRPSCIQLQKAFLSMVIHDNRPVPKAIIQPEALEHERGSALDLDLARSILTQIVNSDISMPPPSQIPEHLQEPLYGLVNDEVKAEYVVVAAKKLSPGDTQTLVNVLDLVGLSLSLLS